MGEKGKRLGPPIASVLFYVAFEAGRFEAKRGPLLTKRFKQYA